MYFRKGLHKDNDKCVNFPTFAYKLSKIGERMKHGLVLEGGGMRCLYTSGILDVFMENGITFDGMIGVSAGATFGCNFKSRQIGRALRYNKKFASHPMYCSVRSLIKTGDLVNKQVAYREVPIQHDPFDFETFVNNPMEFHVVCTDVNTGEPVYKVLKEGTVIDFLDWVQASASMPLVSNAVEKEGHLMLDGGISNSIPLEHFQQEGYERNVVILTQPKGFFKKRTKLVPLFRLFHKYPKITEAMARRHEMYNSQLRYLQQEELKGNTLVIYPEQTLAIGRAEMNPEKMEHIYAMGRRKGEEVLQQVSDFLKA